MKKIFGKNLFFYTLTLLTFVGGIAWQLACPLSIDDYVYSLAPETDVYNNDDFWDCTGEEYNSFSQLVEAWCGHFTDSNMRLSNLLYMAVQLLPVGFVKFLCGLSIGFMFLGLIVLSIPYDKRSNPILILLAVIIFWLCFSWEEGMQSSDFMFNYPVAACFLLLWLWIYSSFQWRCWWKNALFVIFTVFLGFYHEGFSIPLGCYVFVDAIVSKKSSREKWILWAILFACVLCQSVLGPRQIVQEGEYLTRFGWDKVKMLSQMSIGIIALVVLLGSALFSKKIAIRPYLSFVAAIVGGIVMCMVLCFYGRAFWGTALFAVILILRILSALSAPTVGKFWKIMCWVAAVVYALWLSQLALWQYRMLVRYNDVVAQLSPRHSYHSQVVYSDQLDANLYPFYLGKIPVSSFETLSFSLPTFNRYWVGEGQGWDMAILPTKYKGLSFDELPAFPGNMGVKGQWPYLLLDHPFNGVLHVEGGDLMPQANPLARILSALKPVLFGGKSNEMWMAVETTPIIMPDSTEVHLAHITIKPFTFAYRPIERIDSIP